MRTGWPTFLVSALCTLTGTAQGDGISFDDREPRTEVLDLEQLASPYAQRWCILTFITESRDLRRPDDPDYDDPYYRVLNAGFASPPYRSLAHDYPEHADQPSPIDRLMALRRLRLMTLWRGRDSALVLGLNESGYFGVRLDDTVASTH